MNKIYTITMFEDLQEGEFGPTPSRVVGYYSDLNDAKQAVRENQGDMAETIYSYAMIEEVEEGVFSPSTGEEGTRWLFEFNPSSRTFKEIKEPDWLHKYCGFSIG